jgi:dihydroorotase
MKISITGGRLLDPANNLDQITDLHLAGGQVVALGRAPEGFKAQHKIDAADKIVCPGLIDLQARLREPGQEQKATIASETRAAAHGGITTLVCPPDTDPVTDTPALLDLIRHRSEQAGHARVLSLGALTKGLEGQQLAELGSLKQAGCVGVSNGQRAVTDTRIMRRAMEYAASQGLTVFLRAEDPWLADGGCAHEGQVSVRLGLPSIPEAAETIAVARELHLIEQTGVKAHFGQLSSKRAVRLVARAKYEGLPVTVDVAPPYLYLTEMDIGFFDTQCHVRPPLRTQRDLEGLRAGLTDGSINAICSDHQPHDIDAKLAPFPSSEPGISGLETLLPLTLRLVDEGVFSLNEAIASITHRPAEILGLLDKQQGGSLGLGARADVCIFDPEEYWSPTPETLVSEGHNTPFLNWELKGRVCATLLAGRPVFEREVKS